MSKYYLLETESDQKIIGVKNGIMQAEIQKSGFKDKKIYDTIIKNLGSFESNVDYDPDFDFELQYVKLFKSAIATDFLSYGPFLLNCPFLVSDKVKSIFNDFNVASHKFYNAYVYDYKGTEIKYYLFFCKDISDKYIDIKKSIFFYGSFFSGMEQFTVSSLEEYRKLQQEDRIPRLKKIVMNNEFNGCLDFFCLKGSIFVSEKLCEKIYSSGLTGEKLFPAFGENRKWPTIEKAEREQAQTGFP